MKKKLNSAVMVAVLGALHSTANAGGQEVIKGQCNTDLEKAACSSINSCDVMHVLQRSAAQFASSRREDGNTVLQPGSILAFDEDSTDLQNEIQNQDATICYNNCVCVCHEPADSCFDCIDCIDCVAGA